MPKARHRSTYLWIFFSVLVIFALASAFHMGLLRFNYPSRKTFPIHGVDVSHHQGDIHWFSASLEDVHFAYLKATEGTDFKDNRFLYNWQQCGKSGVVRGAYHYFSFCRSGAEQAQNFLATVPFDPTSLPPALDLEFDRHCNNEKVPRAKMAREVSAFVKAISRRFKRPPVFYATEGFYKHYLEGQRSDYPPYHLWLRNVLHEPAQTPCAEWTFWQYGSGGQIAGMRGPIDLNVFCGTLEQFNLLVDSRPEVAP